MKRQQKPTFFIEKRRAVEPPENDEEGPEKDGERSEENGRSQLHEPTASATTTTVRKFRPASVAKDISLVPLRRTKRPDVMCNLFETQKEQCIYQGNK